MLTLVDEISDPERAVVTRVHAGMSAAIVEASDLDEELRDVIRDQAGPEAE
jgi:hypothetical protein